MFVCVLCLACMRVLCLLVFGSCVVLYLAEMLLTVSRPHFPVHVTSMITFRESEVTSKRTASTTAHGWGDRNAAKVTGGWGWGGGGRVHVVRQ